MTRLVLHRLRYELVKFWRDPQAVFFTVALPVVFLVIFASIFGNETLDDRSGLKVSTYYVPGIIALGVMSAAFVALAIALVEQRERGIIKRLRATPLPWPHVLRERPERLYGAIERHAFPPRPEHDEYSAPRSDALAGDPARTYASGVRRC